MEYLYLLFLKCFKGLNTSGWNTLAETLMPLLMFQESSSGKVTLSVLTNNLQIAVCGELCRRFLNQFLLMRCCLWPHTLHVVTDVVKVKLSLSFSAVWEECWGMFSTGILVRLNFNIDLGNSNFQYWLILNIQKIQFTSHEKEMSCCYWCLHTVRDEDL